MAAPRKSTPRRVEETSAGGVVLDRRGGAPRAALIARRDRQGRLIWSLPKGHIEEGETPEQAAVREVREETGIHGSIVASLGTIDFWFMAENQRIHKTVHHYLLDAESGELSDEDAEVVEVAWVPLEEVSSRLRYAGERELLERVQEVLDGEAPPASTRGSAARSAPLPDSESA
jgi:mutator protein MutT